MIDFITSGDVAHLGERYVPQYTAPTQSAYTILGNTIYRSITGGKPLVVSIIRLIVEPLLKQPLMEPL